MRVILGDNRSVNIRLDLRHTNKRMSTKVAKWLVGKESEKTRIGQSRDALAPAAHGAQQQKQKQKKAAPKKEARNSISARQRRILGGKLSTRLPLQTRGQELPRCVRANYLSAAARPSQSKRRIEFKSIKTDQAATLFYERKVKNERQAGGRLQLSPA